MGVKVPKSGVKLTVGDLRETHYLYQDNIDEYKFLLAAYEGIREIVKLGKIKKHERESQESYDKRIEEIYSFEYTKAIIDLLNFYLFKKPVTRKLGTLEGDSKFQAFLEDCNLYQESFDSWLFEQNRYSSIEGMIGVLVDKSSKQYENQKEEIEAGVYPYVSSYFPTNIYDWVYDRDEANRPFLAYLKIYDDDGQYRLWWVDKFEIWEEPEPIDEKDLITPQSTAQKIAEGINPIGEIPFVWMQNIKHRKKPLGMSDVHGVARIELSIIRNLSQGEEVIDYAAFPMMRKPNKEYLPDGPIPGDSLDETGVKAVLGFDAEHPESKPDWLEAKVREPIDAILSWILRKVDEIYRTVNVGGMAGTEISKSAKSGIALRTEFQMLNSLLVRKAINLEKAEEKIIYFWLKWEDQANLLDNVSIERERKYDVEDLASDLENILTSSIIVKSQKFQKEIQKLATKQVLPAASEEIISEIYDEIDEQAEIEAYPIVDENQNVIEE